MSTRRERTFEEVALARLTPEQIAARGADAAARRRAPVEPLTAAQMDEMLDRHGIIDGWTEGEPVGYAPGDTFVAVPGDDLWEPIRLLVRHEDGTETALPAPRLPDWSMPEGRFLPPVAP